jgi:site-specific DNA-methyltransferase (adenine-specific)
VDEMIDVSLRDQTRAKPNRKSKYIPGLAALKFKPNDYWNINEAKRLYEENLSLIDVNKILFNDCITGMEKMPCNCVDLVIADPPFGIDFSGKEGAYNRKREFVVDSYEEVKLNYDDFSEQWMEKLFKIMKPHATAYIFSGWNHLEEVLRGARLSGLTLLNHLIWKYQFGVYTKKKFVSSHYHILMFVKDPEQYYFNKMEHYPQDVWDIKRKYRKGEPKNATTLPIEVVKKCIDFSSKPGDLVFDPFMGMATTAVVAKGNYRHYFGFELNSNLNEVIEARLKIVSAGEDYTPLEERVAEIHEEARRKYPSAYKQYLQGL